MAALFRIVTEGELRSGVDVEQFITGFASTFRVNTEQVRKLLSSGRTVTLKDKLDRPTAEKFQRVLHEQLGLVVRIEEVPDSSPVVKTPLGLDDQDTKRPVENSSGQSGSDSGHTRCPKCGSDRVSGDDCLACGIIISRYRARQAEAAQSQSAGSSWNPYQSTPTQDVDDEADFAVRRADTGDGWQWILGGWKHFSANPVAWIGTLIIWYLLMFAAGLVPFIGSIAVNILSPVFIAGLMLGAREQAAGGNFKVGYLFQGFSTEFAKLIQSGLLYLVGTVLVIFSGAILFALSGIGAMFRHAEAAAYSGGASVLGLFLLILVVLVGMALLGMAFYYVPLLIVFDGLGPIDAVKKSFAACWKNAIPFLVYGLMILGLGIVATIPFGLGLFVLAPVVVASMYVSYRSIFYGDTH